MIIHIKSTLTVLGNGIAYIFSKKYRDRYELETDQRTIDHGLGWQLYDYGLYMKRDTILLKMVERRQVSDTIISYLNELRENVSHENWDKAIPMFRLIHQDYPLIHDVGEFMLNYLGNVQADAGNEIVAINLFKLNVEFHPNSLNAYKPLIKSLLRDKSPELGLYIEKAYMLDPSDEEVKYWYDKHLNNN